MYPSSLLLLLSYFLILLFYTWLLSLSRLVFFPYASLVGVEAKVLEVGVQFNL